MYGSDSELRLFVVKVKLKNSLVKDALETWLLSKVPLSPLNLEGNVFVGRTRLEFYYTKVWTLSGLEIVLRSFLLVQELRIENVKCVALNSFRGRIVIIIMLSVIFVPLNGGSPPVDVLRFLISEPPFCIARDPVIKRFLGFLQSFVFFKLDNLLGDKVDGYSWVIDDGCA